MAIQSEYSPIAYAGNNSTVTPYPITFQFFANTDLVVTVTTVAGVQTTLILNTDYTVTGTGYPVAAASFTTAVAVIATSTVTITRNMPFTQTASYIEADQFPAASHERAIDKLCMQDQQIRAGRDRNFRVSEADAVIPAVAAIFNAMLGLDPAGVPWMKTASEVLSWLTLALPSGNFPTKSFANGAERAAAVPAFVGQIGSQRDTSVLYIGTDIVAGSWAVNLSSVANLSVSTAKLADGALSADAAGRLKMEAAFLMASHLNADAVSGQTADTLLDDTDSLLGYNGSALRKYAGNVVVPPGSIIQTVEATPYTANADITTVIPYDDTIPQITEGTPILSAEITPRFADSKIRLTFFATFAVNSITTAWFCFFRNPLSNAIAARLATPEYAGSPSGTGFSWLDSPATVSPTTYSVRVGPGGASTMRFNGTTGVRLGGGSLAATLSLQEIKV